MRMTAQIARLGLGIWLAVASGASLAKDNSFDLVGDGTGRDLSTAADGTITAELKGQSTLLGNFTGVVVHSFKNDHSGDFSGTGFLRAMNGDLLRFAHQGKLHTNEVPMKLKGSFDVTDGTGAFAGASGKVKFDGTNFGGGIVEYDLEGKLHFDEDDDGGAQDD